MTFILDFIAALLIWIAVGINRNSESELKPFSKPWWIAFLLLSTAIAILKI